MVSRVGMRSGASLSGLSHCVHTHRTTESNRPLTRYSAFAKRTIEAAVSKNFMRQTRIERVTFRLPRMWI
jgi:hypothetical protein